MTSSIYVNNIDVSKLTLVGDRILYDGQKQIYLTDVYIPMFYNAKYKNFSFKCSKETPLYHLLNTIDGLVAQHMIDKKLDKTHSQAKLLKQSKTDKEAQYVHPKVSPKVLYFDEEKKPFTGKKFEYDNKEFRFVFNISKLRSFQRYVGNNMYLNQIQYRDRQPTGKTDWSVCVFD